MREKDKQERSERERQTKRLRMRKIDNHAECDKGRERRTERN